MQQRGSCIDSQISVAAKKISIGRGPHCRYDRSRRNHSPSRQRKLESDSERRRRNERCRRNYSSLRQRKLESDAKDHSRYVCCRRNYSPLRRRKFESDAAGRCRNERCRRNYFSLRQRKLEPDAEPRAATAVAGGPFFFDATKIRIGRECSLLQQTLQAEPCSDSHVWA